MIVQYLYTTYHLREMDGRFGWATIEQFCRFLLYIHAIFINGYCRCYIMNAFASVKVRLKLPLCKSLLFKHEPKNTSALPDV